MKKILNIFITFILILPIFCIPESANALTLAQFEKQVEEYTADLAAKQNAVATNEKEIAGIKSKINGIENQIQASKDEIVQLEKDIDALNDKIYKKQEEVKKIVNFVQKSKGVSSYLEYIFGAKSFTELIYRAAVAEQMSSYNEKLVKDYHNLIEQNNKKQEDLKIKNEENAKLQVQLAEQRVKIEADNAVIRGTMPSVEERIKEAKKNVEYYKRLGCGKNEDINACQYRVSSKGIPAADGFYKPTLIGKITNPFTKGYHLGYDIVSTTSELNIAVHPIAQGQVFAIYQDNCSNSWCVKRASGAYCHGNANIVVIRHNVGGSYLYSTYAHLSRYGNISVGQIVFPTTILGYIGTSGCSTATHLHLELATCHWKAGGGCATYDQYENKIVSPELYIGIPNKRGYRW